MNHYKYPLFLIGLPGSGKTTVGRVLSAKSGFPFIDLDDLIVEKEGQSIYEVFEEKGEEYFRKIEAECLGNLLAKQVKAIISVGGGTPCYHNNLQKMKQAGSVCYLQVSWQQLASRASLDNNKRPLFEGLVKQDLAKSLETKFAWRLPIYEEADLIIKGDERSAVKIADALLKKLGR